MIFLKHTLPLQKEAQLLSPHGEGSVTAAGRLWECSEGRRNGRGGSQQDSLSWSAMEIRAAKKSDLVSHTLSFKVVDFYVINYHFWRLKMHGGETGHMLNHET